MIHDLNLSTNVNKTFADKDSSDNWTFRHIHSDIKYQQGSFDFCQQKYCLQRMLNFTLSSNFYKFSADKGHKYFKSLVTKILTTFKYP